MRLGLFTFLAMIQRSSLYYDFARESPLRRIQETLNKPTYLAHRLVESFYNSNGS